MGYVSFAAAPVAHVVCEVDKLRHGIMPFGVEFEHAAVPMNTKFENWNAVVMEELGTCVAAAATECSALPCALARLNKLASEGSISATAAK